MSLSEWVSNTYELKKKHQKTSEGEEQAYFCWCLKDILSYLVEATGKGNQEQDFCLQSSRLSIYGICCEGRKNLNIRSRRKLFWVNSGPESQDRRKSAKLCYPLRRIISQWPHKESAACYGIPFCQWNAVANPTLRSFWESSVWRCEEGPCRFLRPRIREAWFVFSKDKLWTLYVFTLTPNAHDLLESRMSL